MRIYYDDRACGAGKSYDERAAIVAKEGLYIWAVGERQMMNEAYSKLRAQAADAGKIVTLRAIYSAGGDFDFDPDLGEPAANVRVEVEGLANTYTRGHVIVIMTHEALKSADLTNFEGLGWSLVIDELISVWDQMEMETTTLLGWLKDQYALTKTEDAHEARRSIFKGTQGKAFLKAVAADIDKRVGVQPHIWMCNDKDRQFLKTIAGTKLSPKQSGTFGVYVSRTLKFQCDQRLMIPLQFHNPTSVESYASSYAGGVEGRGRYPSLPSVTSTV